MSTKTNDIYLETKYQDFDNADTKAKIAIMEELRAQGFESDANELRTQMKETWLKEHNQSFINVLQDEDETGGLGEYIMVESERIDLPDYLQSHE